MQRLRFSFPFPEISLHTFCYKSFLLKKLTPFLSFYWVGVLWREYSCAGNTSKKDTSSFKPRTRQALGLLRPFCELGKRSLNGLHDSTCVKLPVRGGAKDKKIKTNMFFPFSQHLLSTYYGTLPGI